LTSRLFRLAAAAVACALAACSEDLETNAGCPILCAGEDLDLRDTTLEVSAVVIDTTLGGFPARGGGLYLLAANSGDTLDARFAVRFDSLPTPTEEEPISELDSSSVRIFIDSALSKATAPVTVEVYDVDTTEVDSVTAALLPLFRAERLLGAETFEVADLKDSLTIFLSDSAVLDKIVTGARLRLGFRVTSPEPVRLTVRNSNWPEIFPRLRFDVTPGEPETGRDSVPPRSRTPADDPQIATDFTDYTVVAAGAAAPPADQVGIGGARGRRVYFRFDLPAGLTDSASIIRASLVLTQRPASTYGFDDTLLVVPHVSLASAEITDLARAASITDTLPGVAVGAFGLPTLRLAPEDTGDVRIEFVNVARFWNSQTKASFPQAIVLRTSSEGRAAVELRFFSTEAAAALRPRIRIVYVPRKDFAIP
jgi:hypothetical protein